ncbi:MAG: PD-(D/E)XK nuclease family protein [Candidatus Hodarchaeota archaeon]
MVEPLNRNGIGFSKELIQVVERYEELLVKERGLFEIIGKAEDEVFHSKILGLFLDPNEYHGLKNKFLIAFFEKLGEIKPEYARLLANTGYSSSYDSLVVRVITERPFEDKTRMDITIFIEKYVADNILKPILYIEIENKINAKESHYEIDGVKAWQTQLHAKKYDNEIKPKGYGDNKILLFLTNKIDSSNMEPHSEHFQRIDYKFILDVLESIGEDIAFSNTHYEFLFNSLKKNIGEQLLKSRRINKEKKKRKKEIKDQFKNELSKFNNSGKERNFMDFYDSHVLAFNDIVSLKKERGDFEQEYLCQEVLKRVNLDLEKHILPSYGVIFKKEWKENEELEETKKYPYVHYEFKFDSSGKMSICLHSQTKKGDELRKKIRSKDFSKLECNTVEHGISFEVIENYFEHAKENRQKAIEAMVKLINHTIDSLEREIQKQ